ncbi:preprotein translocase subunit SecE [Planctomycetota bacterium]
MKVRLAVGILLGLVGFSLCYTVFGWFVDKYFFGLYLGGVAIRWGHVLSITIGIAYVGMILWLLLFKKESIDFLIKVEREIQKVTWPAWDQLKNSVFVILGVIVFFGVVVFLYDILFMQIIWKALLGLR